MDPTCDDAQVDVRADAKGGTPADIPCPACADEPAILEEIEVEDLAVDGICGVY